MMINRMRIKRCVAAVLFMSFIAVTYGSGCAEIIADANQEKAVFETFAINRLFECYDQAYDTFHAVMQLEDGSEIPGIGFTDYALYFKDEDEDGGFFPAGFIAEPGYGIPESAADSGVLIEDLDFSDEKCGFVYAYETEAYQQHAVYHGKYVVYGVNSAGAVEVQTSEYVRGECDEALGALYSYDDGCYLYDPDVGDYSGINGLTLSDSIDFEAIEAEINRVIETQNANFSEQEIQTIAYNALGAVRAYWLSLQEESFFGYKVDELVEYADTLDPMECIRITSEGITIISVENSIPDGPEEITKWTVGICCGIAVVGSIAIDIFIPALAPVAGAVSGAAIDAFMQVVVENRDLKNVKWKKVAIAATSGALLSWACPLAGSKAASLLTKTFSSEVIGKIGGYAVLSIANGTVSGMTNYLTAMVDGEEVGWNAFIIGAAVGAACTAAVSVIGEATSKITPKIASILARTKPGRWLNKTVANAEASVSRFIAKHRVQLFSNESIEKIFTPKSVHEAVREAMREINNQTGANGGGYTRLVTSGGKERHEMPSYSSFRKGSGSEQTRNQANLPAIIMDSEDHSMTASFGASVEAQQYRQEQAELIAQGKMMEAFQMDVTDIHEKFGSKYNRAIEDAIEFATNVWGW